MTDDAVIKLVFYNKSALTSFLNKNQQQQQNEMGLEILEKL
jgi:hypothetical protein